MSNRERRCHWLSRNRRSKRPQALLFFDTETYIECPDPRIQEHSWRLGVAAFCVYDPKRGLTVQEYRDLAEPTDLWAWASELSFQFDELVLISHNIDFDARISGAFRYLPLAGFEPNFAVMAPSCTLFEWKRGKATIKLLDNLNIFPYSLADLGRSVGLEKLSVDFDAATDKELQVYCRRDVAIMVAAWKRWLQFLDNHNLGSWGVTIARQSLNAYRHTFMPCKIGIHDNKVATGLERDAYKGGRCEVFFVGKLGDAEYYKVDVNGLYAAMMSWYKYPRKLVKVIQNVHPEYLDYLLKDYLAIAQVVLQVDNPKFPVRYRNRNVYPTGAFATTLTTPEIEQAILDRDIVGIGRVALYEPADLFSDYIAWATKLRQYHRGQGDFAQSQMCKLLRNTLHGKFGQRGYNQTIIGEAPLDSVGIRQWFNGETGEECTDLTFGGKVVRQVAEGEAYDSFPAIPAHVNAYGRVYMWSLMQMAGLNHVYYIDTDGLIVDKAGYENLAGMIDPDRLGYLKLEGVATDVEIHAMKDYKFGDKRVIKGMKRDAEMTSESSYEQWHFTTLRYAFRSHNLEGVTLHKARRELRREVTCGEILHSGWIKPPRLHLSPEEVTALSVGQETDVSWVWEFNQNWLKKLQQTDDLNWRLARSLSWAGNSQPFSLPVSLPTELF